MSPVRPLTRRMQAMLLVKDVDNLVVSYDILPLQSWMQSCTFHLASLSSHIQEIQFSIKNLPQTNRPYDHEICVQLRFSLIVCFTAHAELCDLIAKRVDSEGSFLFRKKCDQALRDIMATTRSLSEEDINYLDPFMGVCWARAVRLLKTARFVPRGLCSQTTQVQIYGPDWGDDEFYGASIDLLSEVMAKLAVSCCVIPAGPGNFCEKLNAAYHTG